LKEAPHRMDRFPDLAPLAAAGTASPQFHFRSPSTADGPTVAQLVADCPPLDTNSVYCNLLQCTHFADTCIAAEHRGSMVGWISAYRPPVSTDRLFIWQVAVHASARGQQLAARMLDALLARPACEGVTGLITTITADNQASWALFASFARRHGAVLSSTPCFDQQQHFAGQHDSETLVSIAPLRLPTPH
jgi:L-2,4-diaminobutyric acid acetyltransferase